MKQNSKLLTLTIEEIRAGIEKKDFSYTQLLGAYYNRFSKLVGLNAHLEQLWDGAKKQAIDLDNSNKNWGALEGIPIAIKDIFLLKGSVTTCASKILEDFVAPYDAFVIKKLKEQGALMPFKTNMDEFAMGSSNKTSAFGPVISPFILSDYIPRTPGGSSGGSAAAVAANMCVAALGTDTGGSIRQPASFCGIVGFKPTYGRCSRRGVIAFASSLDHPGVLARTVQDSCIVIDSMAGHDKLDATSLNKAAPNLADTKANVKGKKIGVAYSAFSHLSSDYRNELTALINNLKNEGAIINEVELPSLELALKLYFIIAPAEASSNLARFTGVHFGVQGSGDSYEEIVKNTRALFGTEVKRRILIGNFVLLAGEYDKFFGKALKLRKEMQAQLNDLFSSHDVILLPTTASTAFELESQRSAFEMYLEDLYTVLANIYGGPAIQIPFYMQKVEAKHETQKNNFSFLPAQTHLPIGVQLMSGVEDEVSLIEVAKKMEEMINWSSKWAGLQLEDE